MARHNYLIGHNTNPDRNKTNPSRLTASRRRTNPKGPCYEGINVVRWPTNSLSIATVRIGSTATRNLQ